MVWWQLGVKYRAAQSPHVCPPLLRTAFNFAELQAYSSACPALPNLVVPANTTLVNLAAEGCGLPGAVGAATADTGSRCAQSCATGSGAVQRQRGGPAGAAECRSGEWVGPGGVATGPIICGAVCGAVNASSADPSQCTQTVANASWTSAGASGTIRDWYPQWKVYKGASTAALSYGEMEGRAVVVAGSYLTLVGIATVFALNEPLWVATPQPTQSQTVIADVQLGSNASVAGLTLRVNSSVEPASFYVATLLQTVRGAGSKDCVVYTPSPPPSLARRRLCCLRQSTYRGSRGASRRRCSR